MKLIEITEDGIKEIKREGNKIILEYENHLRSYNAYMEAFNKAMDLENTEKFEPELSRDTKVGETECDVCVTIITRCNEYPYSCLPPKTYADEMFSAVTNPSTK